MTIGVLGGGQLGRMLGLAGLPLGFSFVFLDPAEDAPAAIAGEVIRAPWDDAEALATLAAKCDVITWEFENVPEAAARRLAEARPVFPPPESLAVSQDRLLEKQHFARLGIPTPPFAAVATEAEVQAALGTIGLPALLKTRRMGYDGRGQRVLRDAADAGPAVAALGGVPLLLERFVPFERELSVVAARGRDGETAAWPVIENHHGGGILRLSLAPAPRLAEERRTRAEGWARMLLESFGYVGVLALELFETAEGLLANEMAPRVHNSGHWTIEGARTSQFENHVRAVAGLPLGDTAPCGVSAMVNLIGTLPPAGALQGVPGLHLHVYGKSPRPGRKLGHATLCAGSLAEILRLLDRLPPIAGLPHPAHG
jgi:5-(carboxyamino)imidazole ribonucleotide synthase